MLTSSLGNDISSSAFEIPELTELTSIDTNLGNIPVFFDKDGHVYLWPSGESIPIPLKERISDEWPQRLYEEWDEGKKYHKVHSVSKKEDGTYQIVISEDHGDGLFWGMIPASSTGILNWDSSKVSQLNS